MRFLTSEGDVEQIVSVKVTTVVGGHGGTHLILGTAQISVQVVQRVGERVHGVHHELHLRLLLVAHFFRETQFRVADLLGVVKRGILRQNAPKRVLQIETNILDAPTRKKIGGLTTFFFAFDNECKIYIL